MGSVVGGGCSVFLGLVNFYFLLHNKHCLNIFGVDLDFFVGLRPNARKATFGKQFGCILSRFSNMFKQPKSCLFVAAARWRAYAYFTDATDFSG